MIHGGKATQESRREARSWGTNLEDASIYADGDEERTSKRRERSKITTRKAPYFMMFGKYLLERELQIA